MINKIKIIKEPLFTEPQCKDRDECELKIDNCEKSIATCINKPGSFVVSFLSENQKFQKKEIFNFNLFSAYLTTHQFYVSVIRGPVAVVAFAKFRPLGIAVAAKKDSGEAQNFMTEFLNKIIKN